MSARIYSMDRWLDLEQKIGKVPRSHPSVMKFLNVANFYGQVGEIDRAGAIVIPERLRTSAGLNGDVDLLGRIDFLEAWNHERFVATLAAEPLTREDLEILSELGAPAKEPPPTILLVSAIAPSAGKRSEGVLVTGVASLFWRVLQGLNRDPNERFRLEWRQLEEVVAGALHMDRWDDVILTPLSGDGGRDVIAVRKGVGSVRLIVQAKAYSPTNVVTAEQVSALVGTLFLDNASKALAVTTSRFAPGIRKDQRFSSLLTDRLELLEGDDLVAWLLKLLPGKLHGV